MTVEETGRSNWEASLSRYSGPTVESVTMCTRLGENTSSMRAAACASRPRPMRMSEREDVPLRVSCFIGVSTPLYETFGRGGKFRPRRGDRGQTSRPTAWATRRMDAMVSWKDS